MAGCEASHVGAAQKRAGGGRRAQERHPCSTQHSTQHDTPDVGVGRVWGTASWPVHKVAAAVSRAGGLTVGEWCVAFLFAAATMAVLT